jgi:hypothetical protein
MLSSMTVSASEAQPITSSTTSTVTSEFTADDTVVKSGVIVQLPADLDLTYSDALDTFQVKTEVGVYGEISDYMEVKISLPSKLEYTNEDKSATAMGLVRFGDEDDETSYEIWNAAEVYTGKESSDNIDKRSLVVNVPGYNVSDADDYSSDVKFNVILQVTGSTADICAPTTTKLYTAAYYDNYGDAASWGGAATSNYEGNSINLSGLTPLTTKDFNVISNTTYDDSNAQYYSNVKYLQLYAGTEESSFYYGVNKWTSAIDTLTTEDAIKECTSWCYLYHNLQVLVIPSDIQADSLHRNVAIENIRLMFGSTPGYVSHEIDTNDLTFPNSNIAVGNALCFVKDLDENNQFVYVPHIVYHGTIEEWKALSGSDDWVFGNISNVVTVHCTDGILYY